MKEVEFHIRRSIVRLDSVELTTCYQHVAVDVGLSVDSAVLVYPEGEVLECSTVIQDSDPLLVAGSHRCHHERKSDD